MRGGEASQIGLHGGRSLDKAARESPHWRIGLRPVQACAGCRHGDSWPSTRASQEATFAWVARGRKCTFG